MESCSATLDQHWERKVSLDQGAAVFWSLFFLNSSQVLDSIMELEFFCCCFLKTRNRQMHVKKSLIAWMCSLQVLNSCSNTVGCVLSCWKWLVLQEVASAVRLYCLWRLYNCYCDLHIKSLLLSVLIGPGSSDLLLTQSSPVSTVPPPDGWGQLCGRPQKAYLSSKDWLACSVAIHARK